MDDAPAARLYLDTAIAPNRSLPLKGFLILLAVLVAANLVVGTAFALMGAAPILIFLGLDVLGLCLAFLVNYRRSRGRERVQITADQVRVTRELGEQSQTVWASPTAFTRVAVEQTGRYGAQVRLILSGKRMTIGRVLGPRERETLAEAVDQAIRSARAERWEA